MTLKEQLQQAADAGRQDKLDDEQIAIAARIAAARKRAEEILACTEQAKEHLQSLPAKMRAAAKRGDADCQVHIVENSNVDYPLEYRAEQPLDPSALKGLSRRIFELLQEADLEPKVVNLPPHHFLIKIPVPQATA